MALTRRRLLATTGGLTLAGVAFVALDGQNQFYAALAQDVLGDSITPDVAHENAVSGAITLIDIRRPDEWDRTGSGEGANRLDMRRDDFVVALNEIVKGDKNAPIALICARGVRSSRMSNLLTNAGFTNIIDVPEGMLGSTVGPGWLERGLPVVR